jgi:anti-sigma regulatory factor (Ser/Thr protein kinase)
MKLSTKEEAMPIDLQVLILDHLKRKQTITSAEIVRRTGFSRAYVHRHLKNLQNEGKIILIGRADRARYALANKKSKQIAAAEHSNFIRVYKINGLQEDKVWNQIKQNTGIMTGTKMNIQQIVEYGFTEMLNNAIDHSKSKNVKVKIQKTQKDIRFTVADYGIGIFRNIKVQRKLRNEKEAIQDLLKGKQTTAPERHSGEGIYFTSRAADRLVIKSSNKKIVYDNTINDVIIDKTTVDKGTVVDFSIGLTSTTKMSAVFKQYTGEEYDFSKTEVKIALYKANESFISRSQARRVLAGLDSFQHIVLDFQNVQTIGQGFADEVFRVWKRHHPNAVIEVRHANENIEIMISHVQSVASAENSGDN